MKVTSKTTGIALMGVAALMLCTAASADTMGKAQMGGDPGGMGMGMMRGPGMDLTAMDTDKDGKVSKAEATAYRTAETASIDANADGKLSVDELAAMHLKQMTDAAKTMAQRMVDRMDTDGDGMLSAAELVAHPMPGDMFDRLDANKDGFVDQAELDAAQKAMMQRGPGRDGGPRGRHGDHPMKGMEPNGMEQDDTGGN